MTSASLLHARQLDISIGQRQVCHQLQFDVQRGECWAILGQNGTGKTTLLHSLAGLHDVDNGEILLVGEPLNKMSRRHAARRCGLLLQDYQDVFPATVLQTVLTGRHPHLSPWQWESSQDIRLAQLALDSVDMVGMETRLLQTLSGGERRRVALATILTQQPELFLLDEPANHLDIRHQQQILSLFTSQAKNNDKAVMMVLHDINLAARYCSHVLMLFPDGKASTGKIKDMLTTEHLSALYEYPIQQVNGNSVFIPG